MVKKKGFTLIELLAIIFIIGIVLVITVPSVSNIIVNSYKRSYELNLSSLKKAAKDYVVKKSVRIKDGEQKIVTINRLVQENFIKEVRDPQSKELCEGYLVITKNGKNYTYEPFLKCGESFLSENYDDTNLIPPTIILLGDNPVNIYIGDTYHDAGAIARDYQNFDITGEIVVNSNLNTMIPGEYFITYTVLDEAGNIGKATRTINVIDNVKPEITFDPNENNTYSRRSDVAIKVVDIGGVDKESLKYIWTTSSSQPSLSEFVLDYKVNELISTPANFTGTYYLWATAKDMAGNQTIKGSKGFKLDNTEPVIQLLGENPTTIDVDSDYIDAGATARDNIDGDVTNRITITGTVNPNVIGTYTITYMVSDEAGNVATATRTVNVVDLTSPTITFSPNGNSTYAKSRTTKVTVSDAHSGVNTSSLKYLWSTSSSGVTAGQITTSFTNGVSLNTPSSVTGNYYLWILAKDKSDNQKIERSNAFKLDNTRPVISLNGNSNVTIARGTAYTDAGATATDNIDGSVTVTASGSVNPNVIGTYTITYNAIDSSGNEANPVTRKINVIDVQAPVITVLGDNPVTINVGSAYNDAGATALDDVDGDLTSSIVTTGTVNPNVIGTYTITYRATDSSNNVATATRTVNVVDLTSPTITFSPNGNSTYAKSRTTKVTVSDNVIVNTSSLKYLWSTSSTGVTAGQITNSFTNGGTINTPASVTGTYYLWILAKDNSGNQKIERSNAFKLDNTSPTITILGSNPATVEMGTSYSDAGATASDNIDGNITSKISSTGTVNVNALGQYTITYTVSDNSGNVKTAKRTINVVDTTPPTIAEVYAGTMLYSDPTFDSGLNSTRVYNNTANGNVSVTRVSISGAPVGSGKGLEIKTVGTATPGWGGFYFATPTAASKVFITRIIAKIPVGYKINWASNAYGGGTFSWLTDQAGTGDWKEYICRVSVGTNGSYSSTNFFYLTGGSTPTTSSPLVWHVAYATVYDTTKWGTTNNVITKVSDLGLGIVGYGINQSSTIAPTFTSISSVKDLTTLTGSITSNGTHYVWVKDASGNVSNKSFTVSYIDRTSPTVSFGTNGNSTYSQSRSTTVTINDTQSGVNKSSLKYLWNTSTTQPSEASFTTTFTNGGTISSPPAVTGNYYLWILAKDNAGNTIIQRTNVFKLDNTKPVITINGANPITVGGSTYSDAGASATDAHSGINGSVTSSGTVNMSVAGTYYITYNASDKAGNLATPLKRTVVVKTCSEGTITNDSSKGWICVMSANSSSSCNYCTYQVSTYGQNCDKCGSTCKTCTYQTTTPATITSANSSRVCPGGCAPAIVTGGLEYCYCPPMGSPTTVYSCSSGTLIETLCYSCSSGYLYGSTCIVNTTSANCSICGSTCNSCTYSTSTSGYNCSECGSSYWYWCPSGWSNYSGSGSSLKCYKAAN